MTIFSLYIFDRHCECIYYQDWHRTRAARPPPPPSYKPGVHRLPPPTQLADNVRESIFADNRSSVQTGGTGMNGLGSGIGASTTRGPKGLPFDEEAKLVYGVILSLRNMVKKLSGRDEAFTSYSTAQYKLHLYETITGYKFVLLSDPSSDSLRFVLRQLYVGPFVEYVVRNPLVVMDSREEGIDNDQFRAAVDRHMRGLSMFGT
ncbi:hypothetical protein IAR55_002264 [Kwoniella newhampshirensis]|uniref:Trafficking protein particle complex subunit n=1 Tax=Kwoniella newhampshirensis TaxID=1651941 RepID=A0AAW0Z0E7_9TREE